MELENRGRNAKQEGVPHSTSYVAHLLPQQFDPYHCCQQQRLALECFGSSASTGDGSAYNISQIRKRRNNFNFCYFLMNREEHEVAFTGRTLWLVVSPNTISKELLCPTKAEKMQYNVVK